MSAAEREVACEEKGWAPSIENFLDVPHSVQHANDLNRLGLGIVDDEVGVDGPEFHRPAREVLANMSGPWFGAEKLHRAADFLKNLARDRRAGLLNEETLDLIQISFCLPAEI